MLTILGGRHRLCDGVSRRDFLKVLGVDGSGHQEREESEAPHGRNPARTNAASVPRSTCGQPSQPRNSPKIPASFTSPRPSPDGAMNARTIETRRGT